MRPDQAGLGLRRGELLGQGGATETRGVVDADGHVAGVEKRLVPRLRADADAREQLLTEGRVLAALGGVGAPKLLAYGEDDPDGRGPWLVMEHLPFETLGDVASSVADRAAFVATVAGSCFLALRSVHEARDAEGPLGIVHGDLSPANVLVARDGQSAWLIDFGLASFRDAPPVSDARFRGTPLYVAPEVARGAPASVQSDLFSLALSLLHAACGEPPRASTSLAPLLVEAGEETVLPFAARASAALASPVRDALLRAAAFAPEDRPVSAREAWPDVDPAG